MVAHVNCDPCRFDNDERPHEQPDRADPEHPPCDCKRIALFAHSGCSCALGRGRNHGIGCCGRHVRHPRALGCRKTGHSQLGLDVQHHDASWSLGAAIGAFATGRVRAGERAIFVTRRLTFFASLCCFVLIAVSVWWLAAVILVAYIFCHTAQYMSVITLRQRIVPSSNLSRVNAATRVVSYGVGTVGGAALGGYLATQFGYAAVLSFAGLLHMISCLISWSPKLSVLQQEAQDEVASTA
ncbi:MFS transporter [Streptomyces canus]|uniref:MFS transporter n=1 Tax=Streptomyces canus TaxID=58343 RepID=UPI003718805C